MSQDIPGKSKKPLFRKKPLNIYIASVSKLKETANALFKEKSFAEANKIYQSIIEQHDNLSIPLIRIMRSNSAACFIELGVDIELNLERNTKISFI